MGNVLGGVVDDDGEFVFVIYFLVCCGKDDGVVGMLDCVGGFYELYWV